MPTWQTTKTILKLMVPVLRARNNQGGVEGRRGMSTHGQVSCDLGYEMTWRKRAVAARV
jgi:hypothetical protein